MLKEDNLLEYTSSNVIDDAKELYYAGHVGNVAMARGSYDVIEISSNVKDSRGYSLFQPNVWLNPDADKVIDFSCTCEHAQKHSTMCPHATAILLKIMYDQEPIPARKYLEDDPDTTSEITGVTGWKRSTDDELKKLIDSCCETNKIVAPTLQRSGLVELLPEIVFEEDHTITMILRIGKQGLRKYMIRDISAFSLMMKKHEYFEYGKNLAFVHHKKAFTSDSFVVLDFINQLDDFANTIYPQHLIDGLWQGYGEKVVLQGPLLDLFMNLLTVQCGSYSYIKVSTQYASDTIEILDQVPDLKIELAEKHDGYVLRCAPFRFYEGENTVYIQLDDEPKLYRMKIDHPFLKTFLDYLQHANGQDQFMAQEDFPTFVQEVYPIIRKNLPLKHIDLDVSQYLPEQPSYEIYLDSANKNSVSCSVQVIYQNDQRFPLFGSSDSTFVKRNMASESEMDQLISPWFNDFDETNSTLILKDNEDLLFEFIKDGIPSFQKVATVYITDSLKKLRIRTTPSFQLGVAYKSNLLELEITSELSNEELADILNRYDRKRRYYRLKNGDFVDAGEELEQMAQLKDSLQLTKKQLKDDHIMIPTYRALLLDQFVKQHDSFHIYHDDHFETLVSNMEVMGSKHYDVPTSMEPILRDYQKKGYSWLCSLRDNGFCGLLADEMGLGKTIQVIALILGWKNRGRVLVVSPASLVYNWANEFQQFAPELPIRIVSGNAETRQKIITESKEDDIIITSYDLLKRDIYSYLNLEFCCEVIDEAQFIKNPKTKAARAVKGINSQFRIALTGTPIENRLSELWSIFDYLMPGFLYSYKEFQNEFEYPIVLMNDDEAQERLRKMITPFTLRRLKKEVLTELPDKIEEVVYAPLEDEQDKLYSAAVMRMTEDLNSDKYADLNASRVEILTELLRLRQTCCSPSLIYENYKGNSAKEDMCIELICRAVSSGHKVLLFSQFTSMLDILTKKLDEENIKYHKLTGATPKEERVNLANAFQNDDVPVFCISLKAGGTGLNLTAADIVIHYDPWWNTAAENQASDRAHRIGQKSVVTVYRLILKGTIEEKILNLQDEKASLAHSLLSGENISSANFTKEELLELL